MNTMEFFISPSGEVMIEQLNSKEAKKLAVSDREFTDEMYEIIEAFYTEAFTCLKKNYYKSITNDAYYKFLIVRRFIKCNFGQYDNQKDVDEFGCFHFEFVSCPLRGECPYEKSICFPQFNSNLSDRELEVMKLYVSGKTHDEISGVLFISIFTVKNHVRNAFKKIKVHSLAEFMNYADSHNLFK